MPVQRKIFRIEESGPSTMPGAVAAPAAPMTEDEPTLRHHELMTEIMALRAIIAPPSQPSRPPSDSSVEQIANAREFKSELDLIADAIQRTKQEMGGLEECAFIGPQMARVGRELDAVMAGTEQATQNILKAAEDIDQLANTMSSLLKGEYAQGLAQDMRDHVVKIFEACNFQDLTGQRINKVVTTLSFIEDHIARMQDIWHAIENAVPTAPRPQPEKNGDSKFLNGPKLSGDSGHSTQADIDEMFAAD